MAAFLWLICKPPRCAVLKLFVRSKIYLNSYPKRRGEAVAYEAAAI